MALSGLLKFHERRPWFVWPNHARAKGAVLTARSVPATSIDLRAADFQIAAVVKRTMVSSHYDPGAGEYGYEYRLDARPNVQARTYRD
jgi:hypothetical protein